MQCRAVAKSTATTTKLGLCSLSLKEIIGQSTTLASS